jgi:hypothetical protein
MSSPWAVLPPSTWGLPSAALLVDESHLTLEPTDLPALGFVPLEYAVDHPETLPTADVLRVDLWPAEGSGARLFKASETQRTPLDAWGVLRPARPTRPAAGWEAHEVLRPAAPDHFTVEQLRQSVAREGRLLLLTGDLGTFWSSLDEAGLPNRREVTTGGLVAWVADGGLDGPSATESPSPRANVRRRGPLTRLLSRSAGASA